MLTFHTVLLLRNLSLDGELFLSDRKNNWHLLIESEPGKRQALRAHMPEAATDWLNPLSLGTMSASAYVKNLA